MVLQVLLTVLSIAMLKTIIISVIIANGSLITVQDQDISCKSLFENIIKKYEDKNHSIIGYICKQE